MGPTGSYLVDRGDGKSDRYTNADGVVDDTGGLRIDVGHVYADQDVYTISIQFEDAQGRHSRVGERKIVVNNVAPTLTVLADHEFVEGEMFTLTDIGAFTDPGYDTETFAWSIDWGDGTERAHGAGLVANGGPGTLTEGSFDGSHSYAAKGDYTVVVTVSDDDGGFDIQTFGITVRKAASEPLRVEGFEVNDGAVQRSNIDKVAVTFNRPINFDQLLGAGRLTQAVRVVNVTTGAAVTLSDDRYEYDAATLTIDLTVDGFGGSQLTALADGRHELQLDTTLISAVDDGTALSDEDGTTDDLHRLAFHRLLADFDGSAVIDRIDLTLFRGRYRSRAGDNRYEFAYDLDGNGVIGRRDYLTLRRRAGRSI